MLPLTHIAPRYVFSQTRATAVSVQNTRTQIYIKYDTLFTEWYDELVFYCY